MEELSSTVAIKGGEVVGQVVTASVERVEQGARPHQSSLLMAELQ